MPMRVLCRVHGAATGRSPRRTPRAPHNSRAVRRRCRLVTPPIGGEQGLSVPVAQTGFAVAARVPCSLFWASLRTVAEPKPQAPPVTIAEALVRSIRAPRRLIVEAGALRRGRRSEPGGQRVRESEVVRSPTQATYPSDRINTAVGAVTAPSTGSSHRPTYSASISWTRSAH